MSSKAPLSKDAVKKITGSSSGHDFMRSCYIVRDHRDGTGSIALDWYQTSDGRDYCTSDVFMRTELTIAAKIVELLNSQLPGKVEAATFVEWFGD